jgi:hypothetical protein
LDAEDGIGKEQDGNFGSGCFAVLASHGGWQEIISSVGERQRAHPFAIRFVADFASDCVQVADIQSVNETLSATLNNEIEPISFSDRVNDSNGQVRERVGLTTGLFLLMNVRISSSTARLIYAAVALLSLTIAFWFKTP